MKTKLIIAVATLAIVFGLYGLAGKLQTAEPIALDKPVETEVKIKVWFMERAVNRGEMVKRSDMQVKVVAESAANQLGISADVDLKIVKGAVYNRAIASEQAVFIEDVVSPQNIDFIDLVLKKRRVPFAIKVDNSDIIGGLITYGSHIDILALSSGGSNLGEGETGQFKSMSIEPVLMGIKVLQVQHPALDSALGDIVSSNKQPQEINLILELTQKQVATLTIAKRIAELQVHKSIGDVNTSDLSANAGDVLADYKAIKEFRGDQTTLN